MTTFKISEGSENYVARVVKITSTVPIEGADKIVRTTIFSNDVVISKDTDLSKLYIFFPSGTHLNSKLLYHNNLYRDKNLNIDPLNPGGFFDPKGRVKAIKLRGIISTGFLAPLDYFKQIVPKATFKEGDLFTDIDDIWIVKKYTVTQQTKGEPRAKSKFDKKLDKFSKIVPGQFKFHIKTPNIIYSAHMLKEGELLVITEKLHGTSAVFSNVLVNKQLPWYERLLKRVGVNIVDKEYGNLYSSRTVLKNSKINPNQQGYYSGDVWSYVNEQIKDKIEEGITLYGEIVGWIPQTGSAIQKGYAYGLPSGECKFHVYRITYTKPNGDVIEFNWTMVKYYCNKHGLTYVPQLFYGFTSDLLANSKDVPEGQLSEYLLEVIKSKWVHEQNDPRNPGKPAEGVVIRFCDDPDSFRVFKLKNKKFMLMESAEQDTEQVNIEDDQ